MKEHTIALLIECEAGLKMATGSMEQTLPKLSDPGFKTMFQARKITGGVQKTVKGAAKRGGPVRKESAAYRKTHVGLKDRKVRGHGRRGGFLYRWLQYGNEDDRKMLKQIYAGIRREHIACAEGH